MNTTTRALTAALTLMTTAATGQEYCRDADGLYHYAGDIACASSDRRTVAASESVSGAGNPVCFTGPDQAAQDLKQSLESRYAGSPSTVLHLYDVGMQAYRVLCQIDRTSANGALLDRLNKSYYPHFSTILSLYQHNMADAATLKNR